jgi:hypothetical protein
MENDMSKPISPIEARMKALKYLPPVVIDSVNELIETKLSQATYPGRVSFIRFHRSELIKAILKNSRKDQAGDFREGGNALNEKQIVDNGYLDIKDTYHVQGWEVWFSPESGEYTFVFPK